MEMIDNTPLESQINKVVEEIVIKWNGVVTNFQNATITLCLVVKDLLKDYPEQSVREILKKVKSHPNIKRLVSVDRIRQGLRLMKKRPELVEYQMLPEDKRSSYSKAPPYVKKDGEIFWEFYLELAKHPISDGLMSTLEQKGIMNKWTYRELKQNISESLDELKDPLGYEIKKKEKYELIKSINSIMKEMTPDNLNKVLELCKEIQFKKIEHKEEAK